MKMSQQQKAAVVSGNQARRISGQGMTEYIIIVALIAISAIAVVGLFGDVVKLQFAGMAQELSGGTKDTDTDAAAVAAKAAGESAGNLATY